MVNAPNASGRRIAEVPMGKVIPRVIYQTFPSRTLPPAFADNVAFLKRNNPDWDHVLFDDQDILNFIAVEYGDDVLSAFLSISEDYGAARADLFRYLLIYKRGGVYLDIKSRFAEPISATLKPDEAFLISQWGDDPSTGRSRSFGLHRELSAIDGGEYQQWQISSVAGHAYLKRVIERVLANIAAYRPWTGGVGASAVLRVTGPIAYTLAINEILHDLPQRIVKDVDVGLQYSGVVPEFRQHFRTHYLRQTSPVVRQSAVTETLFALLGLARRSKRRLLQQPAR